MSAGNAMFRSSRGCPCVLVALVLLFVPTELLAQGFALSFDGNDFVTFGRVSAISTHTIEAWIKPSLASGSQVIAGHVAGPELACSQGMYLGLSGGEFIYVVDRSGCGSGSVVRTGSLQVGVWTHLAGSFDGSTMRFYRNGNLVGQMSGVPFNASTWMTAGA